MPDEPVMQLANAIAGYGVPGGIQREPIGATDRVWSQFLALMRTQRISGLAVAAAGSGMVRLRDEQLTSLLEHHREAMAWTLIVEQVLLEVAADLEAAGVRYLVLKGASLAHTLYPDPSWRAFGDLDLLVTTPQWRQACRVVQRGRSSRDLPEPRPGFDERFGKATVFQSEQGVQIDLHLRLALGPFGLWMKTDGLFDRPSALDLGGRSVPRLQDTELLLHACVHASLGSSPPLLVPLRDVLQIASVGDVDWTRFEALARRWHLQVVVRHALLAAAATLGAVLPPEAGASIAYRPSAREQRLLHAYTTERRVRGGLALSTLAAIPGPRAKASYLRALVLPQHEFLAARTGADGVVESHLRRWRIPAGWVRSGSRSR